MFNEFLGTAKTLRTNSYVIRMKTAWQGWEVRGASSSLLLRHFQPYVIVFEVYFNLIYSQYICRACMVCQCQCTPYRLKMKKIRGYKLFPDYRQATSCFPKETKLMLESCHYFHHFLITAVRKK